MPVGFHDRPDVAAALRGHDFGRYFTAIRIELGLSQEALGRLVDMPQSRICKIENHQNRLRDVRILVRVAQRFGTPAVLLGFGPDWFRAVDDDDVVVSGVDRRDLIQAVTAIAMGAAGGAGDLPIYERLAALTPGIRVDPPRRIGHGDVASIEATTKAFRDWDERWGGGLSRAAVVAQLHWVVASGSSASFASDEVRVRLLVATSELASVAAFATYDCGAHSEAWRLWLVALDAAKEGQSPELAGVALGQMAHQALLLGRAKEALHLVRLAHALTADPDQPAGELALARLAFYEARCQAALGDARGCERALGRGLEHFGGGDHPDTPPWLAYLDQPELAAQRGYAYQVLAKHVPQAASRAQPLLTEGIAGLRPEYVRSRTFKVISLSATHFQRGGDLEQGVAIGDQALAGAGTLSFPRAVVMLRLRELDTVTAPFAKQPVVAGFRERLHLALADA